MNLEIAAAGHTVDIQFVIFDHSIPAATATLNKTIVVVSPCSGDDIYCPGTDPTCSEAPCALRQDASIEQVTYFQPYFVANAGGAPDRILELWDGGVAIQTICGTSAAATLSVCTGEGADQCRIQLIWDTRITAEPTIEVISMSNCGLIEALAGTCTPCSLRAIAAGTHCLPTVQRFSLYAIDGASIAAPPFEVRVHIAEHVATANATVAVRLSHPASYNASETMTFVDGYNSTLAFAVQQVLTLQWPLLEDCQEAGFYRPVLHVLSHLKNTVVDALGEFTSTELLVETRLGFLNVTEASLQDAGDAALTCLSSLLVAGLTKDHVEQAAAAVRTDVRVAAVQHRALSVVTAECSALQPSEARSMWLQTTTERLACALEVLTWYQVFL
jgi:hypothetical protein